MYYSNIPYSCVFVTGDAYFQKKVVKMSAAAATTMTPGTLLPLELVDKCIGSRIHIIMKNDKVLIISFLPAVSLISNLDHKCYFYKNISRLGSVRLENASQG